MSTLLSFSSIMTTIGYIAVAIVVLLLMVLIHELGHYTAGKILKFKINEFSVGFGPKLFQKVKKNGELFTLRLFPLGGYCAFDGEGEDGTNNPNAFNNQKPWKRLIVLFSGAFFNFLSAIIFSFILLVSCGYDLVEVKGVGDTSINAGVIQAGDVICGIDGRNIDFVQDDFFNNLMTEVVIDKYEDAYLGSYDDTYTDDKGKVYYLVKSNIAFNVRREGKYITLHDAYVNVVYDSDGKYAGWSLVTNTAEANEFVIGNYKYSFGEGLTQSVPFSFKWAWKMLVIIGDLVTGQLSITSLGGPVTTINMIATYTQESFSYLVLLMPLIAVNLAVFNLLPIPALDGFQMIFVAIEWIRKKPIKREVINMINNIGLIVLLGFVVVVDIMQFVL